MTMSLAMDVPVLALAVMTGTVGALHDTGRSTGTVMVVMAGFSTCRPVKQDEQACQGQCQGYRAAVEQGRLLAGTEHV